MNIKAERIEHIIQIVNRNLSLITGGAPEDVSTVEFRPMQKIDAGVFGRDRFAFEMIHFVKTERKKINNIEFDREDIALLWENSFIKGLETLLVECAIVEDDIERECFVSRAYCWFSEKLVDKRDLTHRNRSSGNYENLKHSIKNMSVNNAHTLKALESYNTHQSQLNKDNDNPTIHLLDEERKMETDMTESRFANMNVPKSKSSKFGPRNVPIYVRHGYPEVLASPTHAGNAYDMGTGAAGGRRDYSGFLPKIPGADENYGMIYNVPESDAERNMHELWMARRRQEAFEWKAKQQMNLVMDRLALQKSRMESEGLRKHEINSMIDMSKTNQRPHSSGQASSSINPKNRFAPPPFRPSSSHRNAYTSPHGQTSDDAASVGSNQSSRYSSPEKDTSHSNMNSFREEEGEGEGEGELIGEEGAVGNSSSFRYSKVGKLVVEKKKDNVSVLPMRFRSSLPMPSNNKNVNKNTDNLERTEHYMQLSDSDDEDKPDKVHAYASARGVAGAHANKSKDGGKSGGGKGGPNANKSIVHFKRDKPIVRERPVSAKLFRTVAINDPEIKVHFRHSNYRRMPLTEEQEKWIEGRETDRAKKSTEVEAKLTADYALRVEASKAASKKDKDKDKEKDKKGEGEGKKDAKKTREVVLEKNVVIKPKYHSASQFMATHFPNFDDEELHPEAIGPMRTMQLIECARIMGACDEFNVLHAVKESSVRRALLIPQDRPEAICLENLREAGDGLMQNPNPMEYWRKMKIQSGKGKKKGGKKKKK